MYSRLNRGPSTLSGTESTDPAEKNFSFMLYKYSCQTDIQMYYDVLGLYFNNKDVCFITEVIFIELPS
jgi:hypothetical protein